jgi:tyrosine-specific transport protein
MNQRLFGGVLLVAGTTIGAGMLALPVVTGFAGFIPTCLLFFCYWLYMTFTAFLLLEVNLWMSEQTNLMTMIRQTLGKKGQWIGWVIYLFLLYTLTTAYMAGSGPIFLEMIEMTTGIALPAWTGPLPLLILFGYFVYHGTRSVDYVNRVLMIGLGITYGLMLILLTPHLEPQLLQRQEWGMVWGAISIVSTSFGFHIIIPTLTTYLKRDVKQLRRVLWIGSMIPLMIYVLWEMIILGIVPVQGTYGLMAGYQQGLDGATLLSLYLQRSDLSWLARLFSLFAIITSFLGVSLSLKDFLADGLNIAATRKGSLTLYFLTFIPPLLLVLIDPRAFLNALEYAGAFGVVTLLGLFPILMVWIGRYRQQRVGPFKTPGGKMALILALIISLGVISLEVVDRLGIVNLLPKITTEKMSVL